MVTNLLLLLSELALASLVILLLVRVLRLYRRQLSRSGLGMGSMAIAGLPQGQLVDEQEPAARPAAPQTMAQQARPQTPVEVAVAPSPSYNRVDWLAKAQIFAGIQFLDAKRKGLLFTQEQSQDCRMLAAIYMVGAAKEVVFKMSGNESDARDVAAFLITHNLHFDTLDIEDAFERVAQDETTLNSYRRGIEAASAWLQRHFVPDDLSLYEAVSSNAFV